MTRQDPVAAVYARSLLELANERQAVEPVARDVAAVGEVLAGHPTFVAFLTDPGVSQAERSAVLDGTLLAQAHPLVANTLRVMNTKGRLTLLPAFVEAFDTLLDEQMGKVEVDVTVARRLSGGELEEVRSRVSLAIGREAVVHQYVDESIIGGLILRVGDRLIDGSVRKQLESMRERLLKA